jgi:hypothetical protein
MMLALMVTATLRACPFCTVESRTLTEEIESSDAVVLARLAAAAKPQAEDGADEDETDGKTPATVDSKSGMATFEVVEVLRGDDRVKPGDKIEVVYFGEGEADKTFFVSGFKVEDDKLEWTTPLPLTATAVDYIRKLQSVPSTGPDRLAFFQEYFENDDPLLSQDSYDEFARAPYADLLALKDRMHHAQLVEWIQSPEVNPSRRRLYLTMLGVCGDEADLPMLEAMIESDYGKIEPIAAQMVASGLALGGPIALPATIEMINLDERQKKLGLDAMIGAYLSIHPGDGLDLVDRRFLKNPDAEYAHIYSAIMALRTLGEETDILPREHLLESMQILLDNPDFADQIIPDLARWNDWSVLDRLVAMYKAGDARSYTRQPIVTYLTVASEQPGDVGERGKAALAELTALDPQGVKRAQSLMAFGFLARARGTAAGAGAQRPESAANDDPDDKAAANDTANGARGEFAATAEEIADAEAAEPEDFEDPSGYAESNTLRPDELADEDDGEADEVEVDESAGAADEPKTVEEPVTEPPAAATTAAPVEPLPPVATFSRPVVIAVPIVAAAVLAVVFWLILRWGAV